MSPRGRRGNGARSEDDRQRARLEREQRRARREGRPVPRSFEDLPVGEPSIDPQDLGLDPRPGAVPSADPAAGPPIDATGDGPEGRRARLDAVRRSAEDPAATSAGAADRQRSRTESDVDRRDPSIGSRPDTGRRSPEAPIGPGGSPSTPGDGAERPAGATSPRSSVDDAEHRGTGSPRDATTSSSPWWAQAPGGGSAPPPPAGRGPGDRDPSGRPAAGGPAVGGRQAPGGPRPTVPDDRRPAAPRDPRSPAPGGPRPAAPGEEQARDRARYDRPPGQRPADGGAPTRDTGAERDPDRHRTETLWAPGAAAGTTGPTGPPGDRRSDRVSDPDDWFGPDETGERTADPATGDRERSAPALVPLRPAGPARPSGTAPATVHTRTAPARRGVSRIAAVIVLVPFVVVIAAAIFLFQPFAGEGEGEVRVKIEPGSSVDDIGKLLKDKGVVSNSLAFAIRARISGDGANLKAGTLRLKKNMSYGAALTALQQDPLPPSVVRVSIPEGLSRRETATTVRRAGITGSYLSASARAAGFDPTDYGQPRSRSGLEGFLFPATYELQRGGATAKDLVAEQLDAFRTNIDKVSMTRARRAKLSRYDVLIIASMIEREVRIPSERRLVSAVIWNRLKDGTPLGIDATTRYAVRNWDRPLKQSEIDSKTPYDTRYRKGLPPTPIGSPGLAAIRAAANPANVSYLFYVVEPCGDGKHAFASTNDEFLKDREAYNAAQRRAGGDPSPSDAKGCKG